MPGHRRVTKALREALVSAATRARDNAHAPYSGFRVGAAVLGGSGKVYPGCNVENASYGLTICAERVAIASAVAAGEKAVEVIAVVADDKPLRPCGACLQVMAEFSAPEDPMIVICAGLDGTCDVRPLSDFLPLQFTFQPGGGS
jgi:cytidine deaminase